MLLVDIQIWGASSTPPKSIAGEMRQDYVRLSHAVALAGIGVGKEQH